MRIRKTEGVVWLVTFFIVCLASPAWAQRKNDQVQAASQSSGSVSAEMVKGKLNPSSSKPGDKVAVRLNEDVRSNGEVVMKKGTTINGVVKNVKQADSKSKGSAQSMMEIEWLTPAGSGAATQNLNIALQSLTYTNPLYAHQQNEEASSLDTGLGAARPVQQSGGSSSRQGGLLGGIGGSTSTAASSVTSIGGTSSGVVSGAGGIGTGVAGTVASGAGSVTTTGQSSAGLLAGTSVMPADAGVASALHSNFGVSGEPLFMTGHGQVVSAGGTRESVDLFSHMSNDTVITSPGKNFEVSSGAQMQLLVGVKGR
jgi:hypothetical protein